VERGEHIPAVHMRRRRQYLASIPTQQIIAMRLARS
jgi:hypothetical protein